MIVLFAVVLPLFLFIGAMVVSVGSWYTHARHLQTKVDAGAFAGGGSWEFPCGPQIDARIEDEARKYVGQHVKADGTPFSTTTYNPQVGRTQGDQIHAVLNGPDYYDGDTNPTPAEKTDPTGSICSSTTLDVKGTEENSPLLWGWLPFAPDIKRKARVEIQEAEGIFGLLPIAVRAPEPVSVAAIFYDESPTANPVGRILAVKYFVKDDGIFGMPGGLQGWSTFNIEDSSTWARFNPAGATGVVIAISFRGACNTNLPGGPSPPNPPQTKIKTSSAPCFEDNFATVSQLCNQGATTQIVNCHFANENTSWPSESVLSGLHFIRGYPAGNVAQGQPELRSSWLENLSCQSNAYFNAIRTSNTCEVKLTVTIDVGSKNNDNPLPNPPNQNEQTRLAANTEVKYCLVLRGQTGNKVCETQFGTAQELNSTGGPGPGNVTFSTVVGKHLVIPQNSVGASVAIQVRMKDTRIAGVPGCNLTTNDEFNNNCRFFYTGAGFTSTSVEPSGAAILAAPVQRSFWGDSLSASSVQFLRLTADPDCDADPNVGDTIYVDDQAASQQTGGDRCFLVEMGLKGGIAKDAGEQPIIFNDGIGSSQMGAVDCDPTIQQGKELTIGVVNGCRVWYAKHPFDWSPLCPNKNDLFTTPNPGPPWNDGRWPPLRCIKTRPTGSMNQLEAGLKERFFGDKNANSCPNTGPGFVKGRNYWDKDTPNGYVGLPPLGYQELPAHNTHLDRNDPRIVTIFIAPTQAFADSGQNTYPIAGFIEVYITGFGKYKGNGDLGSPDDPCPGNAPPTITDKCKGSSCGYALWGHILNYAIPNPNATPSGVRCNPGGSLQPCVATLVE